MRRTVERVVASLLFAELLALPACVAPLIASQPVVGEYDYEYYDEGGVEDADLYYEDLEGVTDPYDWYFHARLRPWGEWIRLPGCGYVWRPWAVGGWMPYNTGYWAWANEDWLWVSYEPFGYIVYHFGNWAFVERYGWCWFPGRVWAPHHVRWFEREGHIGWHPIAPRISVHIDLRDRWRHCVWVPRKDFLARDISRRRIMEPWRRWSSEEPHNLPGIGSPSRSLVERWTGQSSPLVHRDEVKRRTQRGDVRLFVPDRETRERVRRDGSKIVRPWLKPKQPPKQEQESQATPQKQERKRQPAKQEKNRRWRSSD